MKLYLTACIWRPSCGTGWRSIFLFLRRSSRFWPEIRPYASGCMTMQPGKIYLSRTGRCIGWFVAGFT
ncbi:TPA: hypothetical protein MHZ24_29065 [Klebsiella pneumoniae subsp. pneumoniae]|nr:hypothetical protein [Salmonella enterica subsp. enterica serovar Senftenberg]HBX3539613.1 hypothetical protein [Klebsiella pneumoniae subsp. pneumoniae]